MSDFVRIDNKLIINVEEISTIKFISPQSAFGSASLHAGSVEIRLKNGDVIKKDHGEPGYEEIFKLSEELLAPPLPAMEADIED